MGCGPSSCSTVAVESVQTEQISVSTATHGWRNHDSRRDVQQRFLHSRRLLALRQTLEAELTQGNLDTLDPRERQMRMDELIARMIFEEELSQMELMRMRVGGMHVWQEAQIPTLNVPNPPKPSPGLTQQEIERVSTRHNFIKNDKLTPGDERTYCYECILCLAEYDDGDPLRVLNCEHIFHVECVDEWLRRNKTCPLCSKSVITTKSNNLDESNCSISSGSILRQRSQVQSLTSHETESNNQADNVASPSSSLPMESYQSPGSSVAPSLTIRVAPGTPLDMPSPYLNLPILQGSPSSSPQLGLPEDRAQTSRSWESDLLSSNATLPGEVPQQPMVVETFNYGNINILPPTTNTNIALLTNNRSIAQSFDSDDADGLPVPPPYQLSDSPGLPETPATLSSRTNTVT